MRRVWGWSPWPLVSWITAERAGQSAVEAFSVSLSGVCEWGWVAVALGGRLWVRLAHRRGYCD